MMLLQKSPRPRIKFSPKSSGTICLMLETLTLLINPFIDFFRASQAILWYSLLVLSVICDCNSRSLAGGIYVPPDRIVRSFSYSAFAYACFSSSVIGLRLASCWSRRRNLSCSCRSRSSTGRSSPTPLSVFPSPDGGGDLRRRGEGDL